MEGVRGSSRDATQRIYLYLQGWVWTARTGREGIDINLFFSLSCLPRHGILNWESFEKVVVARGALACMHIS